MAGGVGGRADVIMRFAAGIGGTGERAYIGGTLSANPLSCVAGYHALLEMERTNAAVIAGKAGDRLTAGLQAIIEKYNLPFVAYNQGVLFILKPPGLCCWIFAIRSACKGIKAAQTYDRRNGSGIHGQWIGDFGRQSDVYQYG